MMSESCPTKNEKKTEIDQKGQQNVENKMMDVWGLIILFSYLCEYLRISIIELEKKILLQFLLYEIFPATEQSTLYLQVSLEMQ